ncbi:MAG: hypothetical protein Kow0059_11560 [Candidatus Sumerlaeia bacterium]
MIVGMGVLLGLRFPVRGRPAVGTAALAFWMGIVVTAFLITAAAVVTGRLYYEIFWALVAAGVAVIVWRRSEWLPQGRGPWRSRPDAKKPGNAGGDFGIGDGGGARFYGDRAAESSGDEENPKPVQEGGGRFVQFESRSTNPDTGTPFPGLVKTAALVIGVSIVVQITLTAILATRTPFIGFDAIGNFALKARLWFDSRRLFPPLLTDPEYLMFKRRYPPVIPIAEGVWAMVVGGWKDERIKWLFVSFWLAAGALVFSELRREGARVMAWVGAGLWLLLPFHTNEIFGGAVDGFGDIPVAMAMLAGAAALHSLRESRRPAHFVLLGVFLAGAFWVKKEGLLFAGAAGVYLLWKRADVAKLMIVGAVCVLFYAVHYLTSVGLPHFFEIDISLDIPPGELLRRAALYPVLVLDNLDSAAQWGRKFWWVLGAAWAFKLLFGGRRQWLSAEAFFFLVLFFCYSAIFLLTAFQFERTFESTFDRIFIHLYPLLLIATLRGVDEIGAREPGAPLDWRPHAALIVFLAIAAWAGYVQFKQTKKNRGYFEDFRESVRRLERGELAPPPWTAHAGDGTTITVSLSAAFRNHPLLLIREGEFAPYVAALQEIQSSPGSELWLQAPQMDPAFSLNYFAWPEKRLRASVITQEALNRRALSLSEEPIPMAMPKTFDQIIRIHPTPAAPSIRGQHGATHPARKSHASPEGRAQ